MADNCNDQIVVPEVDNTSLPCEEFLHTDCVLHPDDFPLLVLPPDPSLTEIINNLYLSLINALTRVEELETLVGIFSLEGVADNNVIQYNGDTEVWENRVDLELDGNIEIGNFTINGVNDSIDMDTLSTFSFRDSADSDIITIDEDTGDLDIVKGNISKTGILNISASTRTELDGGTSRIDIRTPRSINQGS